MNTNDYFHSSRYNAECIPSDNFALLLDDYIGLKAKIDRSFSWGNLDKWELERLQISMFLIWIELYELNPIRCFSVLALKSSIVYRFI